MTSANKSKTFSQILPPESSSQTNRITKTVVKAMFFYCHAVFWKKKTPVELKSLTSATLCRLNNSGTRISSFVKNSILGVLEHLLEGNLVGSFPQFGNCYVSQYVFISIPEWSPPYLNQFWKPLLVTPKVNCFQWT